MRCGEWETRSEGPLPYQEIGVDTVKVRIMIGVDTVIVRSMIGVWTLLR